MFKPAPCMQGILRLHMRLFDYMTPCASPSARRPPGVHVANIYGGYPALAVNPFDAQHHAAVYPMALPPPPAFPPNYPWPRHTVVHRAMTDPTAPWQPCYQPDRPLQAGFLRSLIKSHLGHLRALQLVRCSKVLDLEDYRSIGGLSRLTQLVINNLVRLKFRRWAFTMLMWHLHCSPVYRMLRSCVIQDSAPAQ